MFACKFAVLAELPHHRLRGVRGTSINNSITSYNNIDIQMHTVYYEAYEAGHSIIPLSSVYFKLIISAGSGFC